MIRLLVVASLFASIVFPATSFAEECTGTVHGLSRNYNPATGSGFLAVRAGPRTSASQIGELFNGDQVAIFARRGRWYQIYADGIGNGWASVRWIRNHCGY